jgi:CRP/FNR family transcriptional regulator, cyclic AMP receptor protein
MKTQSIAQSLLRLPFFTDMSREHLEFVSGCATHVRMKGGQLVLTQGRKCDRFYLIRSGAVALELHAANRTLEIMTVGENDIIGWSWMVPPYTYHYDGRAINDVSLVGFDADCVRQKCDADPVFGYDMYKRFSSLIADRLMATRMQLLDVYQ